MATKEINLKTDGSFIHMRGNGNEYIFIVEDKNNSVALTFSPQQFQKLYRTMMDLENATKT